MKYYYGFNVLFKIYKDATLFFSQDKVSLIANVIPTMDRIDALLSDVPAEPLSQSVKHALTFARNSINKYYSKTDLSNVYRIAMGEYLDILLLCLLILILISVLHPQLKLKYFQQRNWAQDWIDTAETIVREEFAKYDTRPTLGPVLVRLIYCFNATYLPRNDRRCPKLMTLMLRPTFSTSQWTV